MIILKHNTNWKYIGLHTVTKCTVVTKEAIRIYEKILTLMKTEYDPEEFRHLHNQLHRFINHKRMYANTVVDIGRNIAGESFVPIARRIYTGDGLIAWSALGNDATAPTTSDTFLGNETNRKAIADSSVTGNVLNVLNFWNLAEANSQHYESAEFLDGSITLDTGNMFARWNIDELKVVTETLSIDSNYTITQ